jgi:hypothetical protein
MVAAAVELGDDVVDAVGYAEAVGSLDLALPAVAVEDAGAELLPV